MKQIANFSKESLIYVDESGIDSYVHSSYGWAKKGEKAYSAVSGKRYARESFIAAKIGSRIIAPMCFKGTCNTETFNTWIEKLLIPELVPGQVIIMDNAAFHKSETTRKLIENSRCKILFLPPYSPDLNPIEKFWAWLKHKIKILIKNSKTLPDAIDLAFNM